MKEFKLKNAVMLAAVTSALAACLGGGDSGGGSAPAATAAAANTVTPVDGKLTGATVFCDTNDNGQKDTGEATATESTDGTFKYTFNPGCTSPIVVVGGTNTDTGKAYLGKIKTPAQAAGSNTFATPLTTLMKEASLTAAQLAASLGYAATVDPTKVDPTATGNESLYTATVAVQQIITQTANALAASSGNSFSTSAATAASQDLAEVVAKAVASRVTATPLVTGTAGAGTATVSTAAISAIITAATTAAQASTSANLTTIKTNLATVSGANLAALTSSAIATQAQSLVQASTQAAITEAINTQQSSAAITASVEAYKSVLTTAIATAVSTLSTALAEAAAAIKAMAEAKTTTQINAAVTSLNTSITKTQTTVTNAGVTNVIINVIDTSSNSFIPKNYLSVGDTVTFNGTSCKMAVGTATPTTCVSTVPAVGSLDTIAIPITVNGTPFTSGGNLSVGMSVSNTSRMLNMVIDKVTVVYSGTKLTSVSVPANATLTVYGKSAVGKTATATLTNVTANMVDLDSNGGIQFNMGSALDAVIAKLGSTDTTFSTMRNDKGTYDVVYAVSGANLFSAESGVEMLGKTVNVTGTSAKVVGKGTSGKVTVN